MYRLTAKKSAKISELVVDHAHHTIKNLTRTLLIIISLLVVNDYKILSASLPDFHYDNSHLKILDIKGNTISF